MPGSEQSMRLPVVPWWARALDAMTSWRGRPTEPSAARMVEQVEKESAPFEDLTFVGALDRFCRAFEGDQTLTLLGRRAVSSLALDALRRRIRVERDCAADLSIAQTPIERPVFITGPPRTGTTLLHCLLAEDPDVRSLRPWEIELPYPSKDTWGGVGDKRRAGHQKLVERAERKGAAVNAIHPVDSPAECWQLLWSGFTAHTVFLFLGFNRPYERWSGGVTTESRAAAYRFYRRQLQHFSAMRGSTTWALKAPEHTVHLPGLFAEFPDATVIQLHRDPLELTASLGTLAYHCQYMTVRGCSAADIGPRVLTVMADWMRRNLHDRTGLTPQQSARIIDVSYVDLVEDPLRVVRDVYRRTERDLSPRAEGRMTDWIARRHGKNRPRYAYDAEPFGLSAQRVRRAFASYYDAFGGAMRFGAKKAAAAEVGAR